MELSHCFVQNDLKDIRKTTRPALLLNLLDFRRWTKFEHVERLYSVEKSFVKPHVRYCWTFRISSDSIPFSACIGSLREGDVFGSAYLLVCLLSGWDPTYPHGKHPPTDLFKLVRFGTSLPVGKWVVDRISCN